ncbi:unnamed protein product [Peronospora belbahrii]|uniref:Mitochondrial Carrier (MC) Family n=1 Tax=Peronospora belbahrii TaxID=622444 RepID=A0ABN8CUM0_9STRA|nr:unnamed protein product [Peronospora belbahrii]
MQFKKQNKDQVLATSALKDAMGAEMKNRTVPVYVKMMAGMAGGVAEACILQPLDVTKTRMQLDRLGQYNVRAALAYLRGLRSKFAGGKDKPITPTINFTAGLLAGCIESIFIVTPFEVIKTRMQKEVGVGRFSGPVDCTRHIVRNEGIRALWKGNVPTMARQGSNQAFNFMAFAWLNHNVWDKQDGDGKTLPTYATFINGLIAGSLGPMLNTPMDVLKTRLMAQETVAGQELKYKGFFDALKVISREEGISALWKGLLPRLTRMAPGQAITWSVVMRVTSIFENQGLDIAENKIKL